MNNRWADLSAFVLIDLQIKFEARVIDIRKLTHGPHKKDNAATTCSTTTWIFLWTGDSNGALGFTACPL